MKQLVVVLVALVVTVTAQSTAKFDYFRCYDVDPSLRMPNTLDNLVALVEKFEAKQTANMDELAEMIVKRYRKDGIVFSPNSQRPWVVGEDDKENDKQVLIEAITRPTKQPPQGIFDVREECGLHLMVSHSIDTYPHAGINAIWDGTINRNSLDRSKRAVPSSGSSSLVFTGTNLDPVSRAITNYEPAVHPVESGVMETPYGPVAAGTLLSGLMAINDQSEYTVSDVLPTGETSYMPSEMAQKRLSPVYAASLAGDLAQMALKTGISAGGLAPKVGPTGRYHNCTTCAKQYSLENNIASFLSRAELFAGIDVLILNSAYTSGTGSYVNSLKLSQLLRLYYSEKGLPGRPELKACNRMQLYKTLDRNKLLEQGLHFMYAYMHDFDTLKELVAIKQDQFSSIESDMNGYLSPAVQSMESFINSYNYDDEGYSQCSVSTTGGMWGGGNSQGGTTPSSEGQADLIVIYAEEGTVDNERDQRQMIGDVARRIGVSTLRSRLGVMRASDGYWILPLTNVSNIGDYACNFTVNPYLNTNGGGGSLRSDWMTTVLQQLAKHYQGVYEDAWQNIDTSSGHSQVVMWQVPGSQSGDLETNRLNINKFRNTYPDVRIIFVGRNRSPYVDLLDDEDDFISLTGLTLNQATAQAVDRINQSPRFFMYPACNPDNSTQAYQYNEASHVYKGAVTPNFTTYIRVPAKNFHYSRELEFKVTGDVRTCFSRTNHLALEDYTVKHLNPYHDELPDDKLVCVGGPDDELEDTFLYQYPCDRYVSTCNPVYISVTGLASSTGRGSCVSGSTSDTACETPNQLRYELSHTGMTCGASCTVPALLLLLLPALLQHFARH